MKLLVPLPLFALFAVAPSLFGAPSPTDVTSAMERAATYFAGTVAVEGGYQALTKLAALEGLRRQMNRTMNHA